MPWCCIYQWQYSAMTVQLTIEVLWHCSSLFSVMALRFASFTGLQILASHIVAFAYLSRRQVHRIVCRWIHRERLCVCVCVLVCLCILERLRLTHLLERSWGHFTQRDREREKTREKYCFNLNQREHSVDFSYCCFLSFLCRMGCTCAMHLLLFPGLIWCMSFSAVADWTGVYDNVCQLHWWWVGGYSRVSVDFL